MNLLSHVLKNDPQVREELAARNAAAGLPLAAAAGIESTVVEHAMESSVESMAPVPAGAGFGQVEAVGQAEAVVLFEGRPSLLIRNDTFQLPDLAIWRERLHVSTGLLERVIPSVCRIELARHPLSAFYPMIGTAWLIAEDVIVTNRHVAVFFGFQAGDRFYFRAHPEGGTVEIRADFVEEHAASRENEFDVAEILHIEDDAGLDMAFLKLRADRPVAQPIVLAEPTTGEFVATIGYPGSDPRVPASQIRHIFEDVYRVKRLAPGMIMGNPDDRLLQHDCSTLKGSSGSAVVSLDTGRAIGLHFSGEFGIANTAVNAAQLKAKLAAMNISVPVSWIEPPQIAVADLEDAPEGRDGYQADFLGAGNEIPLPGLDHAHALEIPPPTGGQELKYRHFSVVMHKDRGLALCAAVNVAGESLRFIPRSNDWSRDSRLRADQQHDNALYHHNDLDRGHMVRRLDPVWGGQHEARQANDDTFFYTNSAPQHKNLNQKLWVQLEEYVLDNARAHDLKISVFTGPVFDPGDPLHRGVPIPRRFWKIVAFLDEHSQELRSTGYLLDQSHLIIDVPEEFAFGAFKTFQVSVDLIARLTTLNLDKLVAADVLATFESSQNLPLTSLNDIVLARPGGNGTRAQGGSPAGSEKMSAGKLQQMMADIDVPDSALRPYLKVDEAQSTAFHPVVTVNETAVTAAAEEAAVVMSTFNGISRWRRQQRYRRKIRQGWDGLRIVSEGDSWFQYPLLLEDVIDQLFDDYAILSFGAAGDLLQDMIRQDEIVGAIEAEDSHACLISGGGNDVLGGGRLQEYLEPYSPGISPEEALNDRLATFLDGIMERYESIFDRLTTRFPELHVFCHGYDYAIPDGGRWLGRPMEQRGYQDAGLQRQIVAAIIDRLHVALAETAGPFDRVHHVDCRGAVHATQWYDELHPTNDGYRTVASRFRAAINGQLPS
jgi:endonuclease G